MGGPIVWLRSWTHGIHSVPERKYKEWKIGMVVSVLYASEADGHVVNISFDLSRKCVEAHVWSDSDT